MTKLHVRKTGFTYCACVPFTKNKEIIQNFQETRDWQYICQEGLD